MEKQPQVRSLERLLSSDNALKESVEISIKKAALPSIANLEDFLQFSGRHPYAHTNRTQPDAFGKGILSYPQPFAGRSA
jgi:hypothetical protein